MGWIVAILAIGLAIGGLVGGTVLHPFPYGLFIASILIISLWLACSLVGFVINGIFGKRQ